MRLRNHDGGYGLVTRTLHWLTVVLLAVQFVIGYLLDDDGGRGRGRGRSGESGQGRGRGGDDDLDLGLGSGDDRWVTVHVTVGLTILAVSVLRLVWRRATPLPPWAAGLSPREQAFATRTEQVLYLCLFLIPLTGLSLVLVSDDLLALHVTTHIAFFVTLAAHLGLVLKHQVVHRDRLLRRMI